MLKKFTVLSLVVSAGLAHAVPSNTVPTSELTAYFHVGSSLNDEFDGALCSLDLYKITETSEGTHWQQLELSEGDAATCSFDGATLPIAANGETETALPYSVERPYSFEFTRANGEIHRTEVHMPYQIEVTAPATGASYMPGEEMRFEWTQGDYDMIFRVALWASQCSDFDDSLIEEGDNHELFKTGYTKGCKGGTNYYLKGVSKFGEQFASGLDGRASSFTSHHITFNIGVASPSANPTKRFMKRIRSALDRTMRGLPSEPAEPAVRSLRF